MLKAFSRLDNSAREHGFRQAVNPFSMAETGGRRPTCYQFSQGELVARCGDFSGGIGPLDQPERFLIVSKHRDSHSQDCFRRADRC